MCVCKTYEIKKIVNIVDIIPSIIWQKLQNMNKERDQNQFFFYKNGPLWSARSGRGNRSECGLAAKANAKDLIRGRGELIKFWALENWKFSWIEKIVPLYIHYSLSMVVAMHKKSYNRAFNKEPVNNIEN